MPRILHPKMPLNTSCTCTDAAYRIEHGTVSENELNISNKLLDTLVMAEVCFAQTTAHSPQVHWIQYDLVVIRNLEHTHITCAYTLCLKKNKTLNSCP